MSLTGTVYSQSPVHNPSSHSLVHTHRLILPLTCHLTHTPVPTSRLPFIHPTPTLISLHSSAPHICSSTCLSTFPSSLYSQLYPIALLPAISCLIHQATVS